jgi:8-oxo-dGTP pyrophosphatase MutT (NUDIX family)
MTGDRCEYPRAAVAIFVFRINPEDQTQHQIQLLLLKKRPPRFSAGKWGLPGGKQELFETAEAGAARELLEETQLRREPTDLTYQLTVEDIVPEIGKHYVTRVYTTQVLRGDVVDNGEPEKHELGWFPILQLPHPLTDAFMEILRMIRIHRCGLRSTVRLLGLEYARRSADALAPTLP